jgi:hypothetical protein
MLKKISIASGVLVLGMMSTGAFAQGFLPGIFGGNAPTTQSAPIKAPGNNRYQPYETPAPVYATGRQASAADAGNWAHNRYSPVTDASASGSPVYASGYYASAVRARDGAHNRYTD